LVTAATSQLPRCCRGGDRGEHVAKGSGDVGVAFGDAWLRATSWSGRGRCRCPAARRRGCRGRSGASSTWRAAPVQRRRGLLGEVLGEVLVEDVRRRVA
jgi:hypothetical protein